MPDRTPLSASARSGAGIGFAAGALAGCLLAARLLQLNQVQPDARSLLVLSGLLAAVYGAAGAGFGAILAPVFRMISSRGRVNEELPPAGAPVGAPAGTPRGIGRLLGPGKVSALFLLGAISVVGAGLAHGRGDAGGPPLEVSSAPAGLPRVLLIGIDGLDFKFTQRLIASGEMPNLASMQAAGFGGPLKTFQPTLSPLIWNTIASGVKPERHGVQGFAANRISGVDASFVKLVGHSGLGPILAALQSMHLAQLVPVGSDMCHVPRVWDVAGAAGRRVGVVNWWATWPADPVNGWLVTDRFYYFRDLGMGKQRAGNEFGTVFPPEALAEFSGLRVSPDALTREQISRFLNLTGEEIDALGKGEYRFQLVDSEFRFLLSMDETYRAVGLKMLQDPRPPEFAAIYLRGVDILCHAALRYSNLIGDTTPSTPDEVRKYGDAVRRYYRYTDGIIGELAAAAGPATTVLVVSDHGFEKQADGVCGHDNAPPGVIFGSGGLIRAGGDAKGATVYDVAPTLLYLTGAPVANDLPGKVLSGIVAPEQWAMAPPLTVATFGRRVESAGGSLGAQDDEYLQRLRALGYIK